MLPSGVDLPTGSISTPVGSFLRWLATVSRAGEPTVPDISTAKTIKEIKLPKFIGRRSAQRRICAGSSRIPRRFNGGKHFLDKRLETRVAADCVPNRLVFKKGSDRSRCQAPIQPRERQLLLVQGRIDFGNVVRLRQVRA